MVTDSTAPIMTDLMESTMKTVYGDWDDPRVNFPLPAPPSEAGPSPSGQRRYLWTDAFGVLNFITMSEKAADKNKKEKMLVCAEKLCEATELCLGNPRSGEFPMASNHRGGHKGLRIGKVSARSMSDPGMELDGMYWHYMDKWIFALTRLAQARQKDPVKAIQVVKDIHKGFLSKDRSGHPEGLYWKVNVDLTPIRGLEFSEPNSDALNGWVVYHLADFQTNLGKEISDLTPVAESYVKSGMRTTGDPLGWGLTWWTLQWLGGKPVDIYKEKLSKLSSTALNIRHGEQLPFRLYGAIIGAKLSGDKGLSDKAETVLEQMKESELNSPLGSPHSTINKVMFATALDPGVLGKREQDPKLLLS